MEENNEKKDIKDKKENQEKAKENKKRVSRNKYIAVGIIIAVIIIAAVVEISGTKTVVAGDNVSVYYKGYFPNGTVFNDNFGGKPLTFTAGSNQLIQGFSDAVIGMSVGENKTITLTPNEAYGPVNPNLIVSVPANVFNSTTINELKPGMVVTSPTGNEGVVMSVNSVTVVVNFNPPLAGKTLIFNIKLVSINK